MSLKRQDEKPAPPYGSREYWDERYKKQRVLLEWADDSGKNGSTGDTVPLHQWYFTYNDLKPLIMPLILGSSVLCENSYGEFEIEDQNDRGKDTEVAGDTDTFDEQQQEKEMGQQQDRSTKPNKIRRNNDNETAQQQTEEVNEAELGLEHDQANDLQKHDRDRPSCDKKRKDANESNENQNTGLTSDTGTDNQSNDVLHKQGSETEEWGEVDEAEDLSDEDDEMERQGLARNGPIRVLEIGCGDVPLGKHLAHEIEQIEQTTGSPATDIVDEIVCCDYSKPVIDMLMSAVLDDKPVGYLKYLVADARKLPFADAHFDLILEKGTLDAMLSDKEEGSANCVLIVKDCARTLRVGGCILLVSHLNAHTSAGLGWLDEVVMPGLRAGDVAATWDIEVHGNNCSNADDESASPGPAVYIIHKQAGVQEESAEGGESVIPLSFFSY